MLEEMNELESEQARLEVQAASMKRRPGLGGAGEGGKDKGGPAGSTKGPKGKEKGLGPKGGQKDKDGKGAKK